MLAIAATLGASGCAAWNTRPIASLPRPAAEQTLDVTEFVTAHNQNANQIKSLEARPSIMVQGKLFGGHADGRLAMERPRNFKLELLGPLRTVRADIGSNKDEFWFWVNSDEDRNVYWCGYDELASSALAVTYQPDWIIDSLGLKPISRDEAARVKVHEGDIRGTTALIFPAETSGTETFTRMMIVWNKTHRIKEHRIYEGTQPSARGLLAHAEVANYADFSTGASDENESAGATCYLPEKLKLNWARDQLVLDVTIDRDKVKVNQFDSSRSARLFVEPSTAHDRVNLAEFSRTIKRDSGTRKRQTLPAPASRAGLKPSRTTSVPNDTSMVPKPRTRPSAPVTTPLEGLVSPSSPLDAESASMPSSADMASRSDLYQVGR
jgi:hypothetical protein